MNTLFKSRGHVVPILLLLCLLLGSCTQMKALQVRRQAQELYNQGRTEEIIPLLEDFLPELREQLGPEHEYVAECLNGLGMTYGWVANDFVKSERAFREALAIREKIFGPEHKSTLETQSFLGILYLVTGRYAKAEKILTHVVEVQEKVLGNEHPDTAESRLTLGQVYMQRGLYQPAEQLFLLAARYEQQEVTTLYPSPADAISSLGSLYLQLGDHEQANQFFMQALEIKRKAFGEQHSMIAQSYDFLANVASARGDYDTARQYAEKALAIRKNVFGEQHGLVGDSLLFLSLLEMQSGRKGAALDFIQQAVAMYAEVLGPDNPRTLMARMAETIWYLGQGDFVTIEQKCEQILLDPAIKENREIHWLTLFLYGTSLARQNKIGSAIFFEKQAVNIIQELRGQVSSFSPSLQKSYLVPRTSVYRELAGFLIDQGRLAEAGQIITMLKEEEFSDYLRGGSVGPDTSPTQIAFTVVEENWDKRYLDVQDRLVDISREAAVLRKKRSQGLTPQEEQKLKQLRQDLKLAKTAYRRFLETLDRELASYSAERIREISSRNLDKLKSMQGVLRELNGNAVLIHYLETDSTLYLILTTDQVQVVRRVAITSRELNRLIMDFRTELQNPDGEPLEKAGQLYNILFAPLAAAVEQSGAEVLMLSMDGPLRYLPAAALHDGTRYLIEKYAVVLFTEAAKARLLSRPPPELKLAGLGVTRPFPGFDSLPAVQDELESIVVTGKGDTDGVLQGIILLDQDFTGESFVSVLDERYSVLHIASHFVFRPGTEYDSFLLLGDGTTFSLADMYDEDIDFNDVELLTLSACETGLGAGSGDGREIEGFGSLAQRQGAKTVLATLWPVADMSTAQFMPYLYSSLARGKTSRAKALQLTQKHFINSEELNHPFFWGSFILMGNWL
jgi:CHAT domain-containing protein/Flp pilus assembly protein TadD